MRSGQQPGIRLNAQSPSYQLKTSVPHEGCACSPSIYNPWSRWRLRFSVAQDAQLGRVLVCSTPIRRLVRQSFRSFRRRSEVGYAVTLWPVAPLPRNPYRQPWLLRNRPDYPPKPGKRLVKHRAGVQLQETYLDTVYRVVPVRW